MNYFNSLVKRLLTSAEYSVVCAAAIVGCSAVYAQSMTQYSTLPRLLDQGVSPLVMLAMSNDHQLYFKAYTDFDDLDNSGRLDFKESTYDNDQEYEGYFSKQHCYSYANNVFSIAGVATGIHKHYCNGSQWSGNFLNWATMTRIDVLRSILYGGYRDRSTETASNTILERSYLPNDAHSFAKYYRGTDINQLTPYSQPITICNTTKHTQGQYSANNTAKPLMRVVQGNYALWASGERHQCLLQGEYPSGSPGDTGVAYKNDLINVSTILDGLNFAAASEPPNSGDVTDYQVRVQACPSGNFIEQLDDCTAYSGGYKPEGLLQKYGIPGDVNWGLMTGGYRNNKSGGVLRKNFDDLAAEVNDDGTFSDAPGSIFNILDSFRISNWKFAAGNDDTSYNENCIWGDSRFTELNEDMLWTSASNQRCSDWGNPIGEILAESYRYFAGAAAPTLATPTTNNREDGGPAGAIVAAWEPVTEAKYACANMNVLGLNSGAQTFDSDIGDFLDGIGGGPTANAVASLTDAVGTELGVGGKYFIGKNGALNDETCTVKTLQNLSAAEGACPDAPRQEGSWNIAGLARFVSKLGAADRDINALDGEQKVSTHGVQLSTALPQVNIGDGIVISPYCENRGHYNSGDHSLRNICALVDFRVIEMDEDSGTFYVNWEDSEQGGDFDQDMHGLISYELKNDGALLEVKTQVIGQSSPFRLGFGYVLAGVGGGLDGVYIKSGTNGFNAYGCIGLTGAAAYDGDQVHTGYAGCGINNETGEPRQYGVGLVASTAKLLSSPLAYAAKASCGEFINNNNPSKLKQDLERIISTIGPTTPNGGGEAAASTSNAGRGLYLHTVYYAKRESAANANECNSGDVVTWVGQVGALYKDGNRLREDTVRDGVLTNADRVVEITQQTDDDGNPIVHFYNAAAGEGATPTVGTVDDISYIWSTTETLNTAAPSDRNIYTRVMTTPPASTDVVTATEDQVVPFDLASFTNAEPLLGQASDLGGLVDFITGVEITGDEGNDYRNRTLGGIKYLLGDVVTSPVIQGAPDYSYASELNDPHYPDYVDHYEDARKVVYVASNNGMIQAFNAGVGSGDAYTGGDAGGTSYTLGEELWAYVPFNLLPHLQWLADPNYQRVPYFDGYMRTFDIKAFASDAVHPGGWGTILVVGTGMGGGAYPIELDGDTQTTPDLTTRPAYIIFDITDRNRRKPKVIAEISHAELGFTTGEPDVIRMEKDGQSGWYLVFGSGPRGYAGTGDRLAQLNYQIPDIDDNSDNAALENPRLFALKFNRGSGDEAFAAPTLQAPVVVTQAADNAFITAINGMDWDRDFKDDAIYFGTVSGTQAAPSGKLMRAALTFDGDVLGLTPSVMVDTQKPVTRRPVTVINNGNYWVFAGTGRYFVRSDAATVNTGNMFFGIIEPEGDQPGSVTEGDIALGSLVPTRDIRVAARSGQLADSGVKDENGNEIAHIDGLRNHIQNIDSVNGWVHYFKGENERQHTIPGYLAATLYVTTTVPSNVASCEASGDIGYLYLFDMRSGVYSPYVPESFTAAAQFSPAGESVQEVVLPATIVGGGYDINDPANGIAVGTKSETIKIPELDLGVPSQRHSWREVTIPW